MPAKGFWSLTLYVQPESPGKGKDKEANWLPSPAGKDFSLYLRAYWPTDAVLNGQWTPPGRDGREMRTTP